MTNAYDYIGRIRGDLELVGEARGSVAQIGRVRGGLDLVGVSDVLGLGAPAPFDPSTYGSLISYHPVRDQGYVDGQSVSSIADTSGNGHTITAPSGSSEGVYVAADQTIDYDGNDYYVGSSRTPYDSLHQTPTGTVVVRVALDSTSTSDAHILFATATESGSNIGVTCMLDDRSGRSNRMQFYLTGGTAVYSSNDPSGSTTLTAGVHTVLAWAWDGTDVRLYQDGVMLHTESASGETPSAATSTSLPTFGSGPSSRFDLDTGSISDFVIYSDKLDAADVAALTTALEAEYV